MTGTDGKRIYAVGDIHGCRDALDVILGLIESDLGAHPHPDPTIVFVGDYADRGPDSRGVIEALIGLARGPVATVFLRGNHDACFLGYLDATGNELARWLYWLGGSMGGARTLASYGVTARGPAAATQAAFRAAVPEAHLAFLRATPLRARIGGYAFVHAGIRPGIALDAQDPEDLIWIRDPFLLATEPHEAIIVHGHTPAPRIAHHGNRIGIDTGIVFGGPVCCLGLEDEMSWVLSDGGRTPLAAPRP